MYGELHTLLNQITQDNLEWKGDVSRSLERNPTGMIEVDSITILTAQLAFFLNQMMMQFYKLNVNKPQSQVNTI